MINNNPKSKKELQIYDIFTLSKDLGYANLVIKLPTFIIQCISKNVNPVLHEDIFKYDYINKCFDFSLLRYTFYNDKSLYEKVTDPNIKDNLIVHNLTHFNNNLSFLLRILFKPSIYMSNLINEYQYLTNDAQAAFHIRLGTNGSDSKNMADFPTANETAIQTIIKKMLNYNTIYLASDSNELKNKIIDKYKNFINIKTLDLNFGYTTTNNVEKNCAVNSILEWFLLSKWPKIYTTMGGFDKNKTTKGLTSTFGYTASIYGNTDICYIYNDGTTSNGYENNFHWS